MLHGADLGVRDGLAPAPVQAAGWDSSGGAAVAVVGAVTGALHHGRELRQTLRPPHQQVVVDTEAADVQIGGGHVVVAATLRHVQN